MSSSITKTIENRIGLIILNRADYRNALDDTVISELTDVVMQFSRSPDIRVIVLTGDGSAFCSGMDITYLEHSMTKTQEENTEDARNLLKLLLSIHNSRKITIAMVNGPAIGGGCGLASACDYVFAAKEKAKFGVPEVRMGFVPAVILEFLIQRMGEGKTREFVLQGEIATALTAKEYGLVSEVISDDLLQSRVMEFASSLCNSTSPASVTLTKELFSHFDDMNKRAALELAANVNAMIRKTEDFKKGMEAFIKKEKIQW